MPEHRRHPLLELADVSDVQYVILRLGKLRVLDATGARALGDIVERLEHRGVTVLLASVRPEHRRLIDAVAAIDELERDHRVVASLGEALAIARVELGEDTVAAAAA